MPRWLIREGEAVRLSSNALDNPKRPYPEGRELLALVLEVLRRELSKIAHFKLLRDVVEVVVIGHSILGLEKAAIELLI